MNHRNPMDAELCKVPPCAGGDPAGALSAQISLVVPKAGGW